MTIELSSQLIGQTEKTLNAILRRALDGTGLTEPQWVTMRVADQLAAGADARALATAVTDRAHFADADDLVAALAERGILQDGQLTSAGRQLLEAVQATTAGTTAPI